jgi:hypothetical protein
MVQDPELMKAVAALPQRSERQSDLQKLVGSFVDVGIMPQVNNVNNQVMYGRRGTGKTHVLKVLGSELASKSNIVCYIDGRNLGSTAQFTDFAIPLTARCMALFRDILSEVHNSLLEHLVTLDTKAADAAFEELTSLARVTTENVSLTSPDAITERGLARNVEKAGREVSIAPDKATASGHAHHEQLVEGETTTVYKVSHEDKIIFPSVTASLNKVLSVSASTLYILFDEWSSLPLDVQPYLAEFFKRVFLPLASVTVKIASLEYRSDFRRTLGSGQQIGFEMGADVSAALDIDDYYVYDRNPARITNAFADMLFRHLRNELPSGHLQQLGIDKGAQLAAGLFSEQAVFQELVRASEGVARDLINIFNKAYFIAHRKGKDKIERSAILEAARQWFEQDKETNLDEHLRLVLRRIIDEVIGEKKARSFLLPRELSNNPVVQRLFDLRVLHLVQHGYADKDRPGVRYNIYTLDYGTYVDLLNTSKRPQMGFEFNENPDPNEFVVPFDDKRSIRRIILSETTLAPPS